MSANEGTRIHSADAVIRDGNVVEHKTIPICTCGRGNLHPATKVFRQRHNNSLTTYVCADEDSKCIIGLTLDSPSERQQKHQDAQRDYVNDGVMYMKPVEDVEASIEHLLKQMSGCDVYFEDQIIE